MKKPSVLPGLALLAMMVALAGCSTSTPIRYHTLVPASDIAEESADETTKTVHITTLTLPAPVDRSQIVVRRSDSGLAILESDWWSATLVEELRSALSAQLASQSVSDASSGKPVRLDVEIRRFDSVPNAYALIDAQWTLKLSRQSERSELTCSAVMKTSANSGLEALILAQQKNVRQLAEAINRTVANLRQEQSSCQ